MSTRFIAGQHVVWAALRKVFGEGRKAQVAVAFLSKGAFSRLKLRKGSTLVVNAGLEAVRSGQTDPRELIKYVRAGVRVYSQTQLHAKVFVVSRSAYVGSANVSFNSEHRLIESITAFTDAQSVGKARQFVMDLATERLGPEALRELKAQYREPKLMLLGARGERSKAGAQDFPLAVSLITDEWSDEANAADARGQPVARKRLCNSRDFRLENFKFTGEKNLQRLALRRYVYQVIRTGNTKFLHPGGRIVHVEPFKDGGRPAAIIYVELKRKRRARRLTGLLPQLGETGRLLKSLKTIRDIRSASAAARLARLFD